AAPRQQQAQDEEDAAHYTPGSRTAWSTAARSASSMTMARVALRISVSAKSKASPGESDSIRRPPIVNGKIIGNRDRNSAHIQHLNVNSRVNIRATVGRPKRFLS